MDQLAAWLIPYRWLLWAAGLVLVQGGAVAALLGLRIERLLIRFELRTGAEASFVLPGWLAWFIPRSPGDWALVAIALGYGSLMLWLARRAKRLERLL